MLALIAGCGGGNIGEEPVRIRYKYDIDTNIDKPIGTILAIYGKKGETLVEAGFQNSWNSYCQNDYGDLHIYEKNDQDVDHRILGKPARTFKSGYIWKWDNILYAEDKGVSRVYSFDLNGVYSVLDNTRSVLNSRSNVECGVYLYNGYKYTYWESKSLDVGSVITACDSKGNCSASLMDPKTWMYSYAGQGDAVVSATNNGRIFIHNQKDNFWCEASFVNKEYLCLDEAQVIRGPNVQFYSSIQYGDAVLLGMYPGGHIYQFRDKKLTAWVKDWRKQTSYDYAEAQSMSLYCGSLYVGYWPWGELYRHDARGWVLAKRLFSKPLIDITNADYPYSNRMVDNEPGAFYGQRVSNLVQYDNFLIASTSNLISWYDSIGSGILSKELAEEYGLIHSFSRQGCLTAKVMGLINKSKEFVIEIYDNKIVVISESGTKSMAVKITKSDISRIEFPINGDFGAYLGGAMRLIDVKGL